MLLLLGAIPLEAINSASGYEALRTIPLVTTTLPRVLKLFTTIPLESYNSASGFQSSLLQYHWKQQLCLGFSALYSNTTGERNSAWGYEALFSNTTGSRNSASGYQALFSNTTGSNNSALGYLAGFALNSGSNNVFIGSNACGSITAANNFFCFGNSAGTPLAFNSNSGNVVLGKESGNSQVTIHGDLYVTGNIINANAGINTGTQNSDIDQISEITLGY